MKITIRTNNYGKQDKIKLCDHIAINGSIVDRGNPEYIDRLEVYCVECDTIHVIEIWIN